MENLTLVIPAKYESESLPSVLSELSNFNCQKNIVNSNHLITINLIATRFLYEPRF